MKKEIFMAAAAAAAGLVYLVRARKLRKHLKEEASSIGRPRHHLTDVFSKAKDFSRL
jgi:hypothetical protein